MFELIAIYKLCLGVGLFVCEKNGKFLREGLVEPPPPRSNFGLTYNIYFKITKPRLRIKEALVRNKDNFK